MCGCISTHLLPLACFLVCWFVSCCCDGLPAGDLLQLRPSLSANIRREVAALREAEGADDRPAMPSYGTTVSVMSGERETPEENRERGRGSSPYSVDRVTDLLRLAVSLWQTYVARWLHHCQPPLRRGHFSGHAVP